MELCPWLQFDPADPLAPQEHRGEAEAPPVLGDHLGGGTHVGVEPGAQVGELGLEGGCGDQPGVALGDEPPGVVASVVVGPCLGADLLQSTAAEDRPHPAAQQPQRHRHDRQHDQGPGNCGEQLVFQAGGVGVPECPGRKTRPQVVEEPWGGGHTDQKGDGHRHEQPPGISTEPAVHGARHHEPRERGRVAQVVHPFEPRCVVGRLRYK